MMAVSRFESAHLSRIGTGNMIWSGRLVFLSILVIMIGLSPSVAAQGALGQTTFEPVMSNELTRTTVQIFVLITVLSLAPGIAMMVTCMPFMLIVLSILRQAIGLQQAPPTMMLISLALFLTFFVMEPVFNTAWENGVTPYLDGQITDDIAYRETFKPFRSFMESRVREETVAAFAVALPARVPETGTTVPNSLLIPAFMISEIERGFQIGFVIFLPFLIIDLVVASILMAMGMMMVPPVVVSLPFKIAFIVLASGWTKISTALVQGYAG